MKPSTKSISLTSSDARLIRKACLTFTDVPFSAAKPRFESDVIPFLDTLFDLLLEKRRQLKDSAEDISIRLSQEELCNLCIVLESILAEYANNDVDLELHVGRRNDVRHCLSHLRNQM
jgi:hypothetical protein